MPAALKTTLTDLGESRVRLRVEVPAQELEGSLQRKASQLGAQLKLPGFRRGKVPAPLVIQRVGRETVLEEAVRDRLAGWYSDAIEEAGIVPIGDPAVDLGEMPPQGQPLEFSIEIGVLPTAQLGSYRGLEVGRREVEVADEQVESEVQAMRERLARLDAVERAAEDGDFVVIDYLGKVVPPEGGEPVAFAGGEGRDQLVELGSGHLVPGFEEGLVGAAAAETRTVKVTFPADYPNGELAGREATFEVTVKEVKRKQLPELGEDFAVDAGFDDLDELREDVRGRIREADEASVEAEFRQAALDAAVGQASVGVTQELIGARAKEMWERMLHSLAHRGISREVYLQITGRNEADVLAEMEPEAEIALRREAVISAIVAAEGIEPGEEELLEALRPTAEREGVDPAKLADDLRAAGRLDEVREDLAARQAIDLIASSAKPIPLAKAQARERLWTPEKAAKEGAAAGEAAEQPGQLWTPTDLRSSG